jgi:glycerophosphoryl diester phosphodiesterase
MRIFILLFSIALNLTACSTLSADRKDRMPTNSSIDSTTKKPFMVHAHRGVAHLPENMMSAFMCSAQYGADMIEMDLQITKDNKIIVAHDVYFKDECSYPNGRPVESKKVFFRDHTLEQVQKFDCGSRTKNTVQPVPGEGISSLAEVLAALENTLTWNKKPIGFNIEIKYNPTLPQFYPSREKYAYEIMKVIDASGIDYSRIMIQSFDFEILEEVRKIHSDVRLSPLVGDEKVLHKALVLIKKLNTDMITPHYSFVTPAMLEIFQKENGIQVVPWTVNTPEIKEQLLQMGIDGVITDNLQMFRSTNGICK